MLCQESDHRRQQRDHALIVIILHEDATIWYYHGETRIDTTTTGPATLASAVLTEGTATILDNVREIIEIILTWTERNNDHANDHANKTFHSLQLWSDRESPTV